MNHFEARRDVVLGYLSLFVMVLVCRLFNGSLLLLLERDLLFPVEMDSSFKLSSLHYNTVSGHLFFHGHQLCAISQVMTLT